MKRTSYFFSCLLLLLSSLSAQTIQPGKVLEYNQKAKKTPLSGVELTVRQASSTVSDKDGNFRLQFQTLRPGEKVNYRSIEKPGYEIFNREALEQWNINPNSPFVIIMCRSDRFKKLCDTYYANSSKNYKRQYEKEKKELEALKNERKIKEEEYFNKLREAEELYEQQLDNLDNYVDRFARIDLSELSEEEQEIMLLVEEGKFDEAIAKYEALNLLHKYETETQNINRIKGSIEKLEEVKHCSENNKREIRDALYRHVDALLLSGGGENVNRAREKLFEAYRIDTLDISVARRYAKFLYDNHEYHEALPIYVRLITLEINPVDIVYSQNILMQTYSALEDFDNAFATFENYEKILTGNKNLFTPEEIVSFISNKGLIYQKNGEIHDGLEWYESCLSLPEAEVCDTEIIANIKNRICNLLSAEHRYDETIPIFHDILNLYLEQEDGSEDSNERIAGILTNLSHDYRQIGQLDKCKTLLLTAQKYAEKCYNSNPNKYFPIYTNVLNHLGNIYGDLGINEEADKYFKRYMGIISPKYDENPEMYWRGYSEVMGNLGILFTEMQDFSQAVEYLNECADAIRMAPESPYRNFRLTNTLYNRAYIYCITEEFEKARDLLLESMIYSKSLFDSNPRNGAHSFISQTLNLAYCYDKLGCSEEALKTFNEGKKTLESLELQNNPAFVSLYGEMIYNIGEHIHHKDKNYKEAIPHYEAAYDIFSQNLQEEDMLDCVLGLADIFLTMEDIDQAYYWLNRMENKDLCYSNLHWLNFRGVLAFKTSDLATMKTCKERMLELTPDLDISNYTLFLLD